MPFAFSLIEVAGVESESVWRWLWRALSRSYD